MKSVKVVLFLTTIVVAQRNINHVRRILECKGNFFKKIHGDIHNITHRIFFNLLKNSYAESPKNKLYLSMHNDLNSIAEKNYEKYIEMRNISKPPVDNTVIKKFFSASAVIKEILYKEIYRKPDIEIYDNNITSDFDNSHEFANFIKKFANKFNKLGVDDLFKQSHNNAGYKGSGLKKFLKPWRPTKVINDTRRLYHGEPAKVSSYPFMASIHIMGELTCAGSIISEDMVLTAASCLQVLHNNRLFREIPKLLHVRVGSTYGTRGGDLVKALQVSFYPAYDPANLLHNLAIIRLSRHIRFTKHTRKVKRIELDTNVGMLAANTPSILMLGWGAKDRNNIVGLLPKLSVSVLDVYLIEDCKNIYSRYYVTDRHFCAGFVSKAGGACNKDAGGPGVVGGLLAGVISFGPISCGTADSPTVFTRVSNYINWIEEIMERTPLLRKARTTTTSHPYIPFFTLPLTPYPYDHTRHPVYPIMLRGGTKTSMEAILLKQILNEVIFSKSDVLKDLMYIEPDWGEADFNDLFTPPPPPSTTPPEDLLYGPMDDGEIATTTQKSLLRDGPLIDSDLDFIPEYLGIYETTKPAKLPPPSLSPTRRPWVTTPPLPIPDEVTTRYLVKTTYVYLERDFNAESFSNNYDESESDSDESNTHDFTESKQKGYINNIEREPLREQPYEKNNKKMNPKLAYTVSDQSQYLNDDYTNNMDYNSPRDDQNHNNYKNIAKFKNIVDKTEGQGGSKYKHREYLKGAVRSGKYKKKTTSIKRGNDTRFKNTFKKGPRPVNYASSYTTQMMIEYIEDKRNNENLDSTSDADLKTNNQREFNNYNDELTKEQDMDSTELRSLLKNVGKHYTLKSETEKHVNHGPQIGRTMIMNTYEMDRYERGMEREQILFKPSG